MIGITLASVYKWRQFRF